MKTAEEQLIDVRVAFIRNLYKGQPEKVINDAIKHIHRMTFDSVEDFESWAKEGFQNDPNRQATNEELDSIMNELGLGTTITTPSDNRSDEQKMIDDIMSHI